MVIIAVGGGLCSDQSVLTLLKFQFLQCMNPTTKTVHINAGMVLITYVSCFEEHDRLIGSLPFVQLSMLLLINQLFKC